MSVTGAALISLDGIPMCVASAEDVILSKLVWARLGEAARQMEDVVALLRVRSGDLDLTYLEASLDTLQVRGQWDDARTRARKMNSA